MPRLTDDERIARIQQKAAAKVAKLQAAAARKERRALALDVAGTVHARLKDKDYAEALDFARELPAYIEAVLLDMAELAETVCAEADAEAE